MTTIHDKVCEEVKRRVEALNCHSATLSWWRKKEKRKVLLATENYKKHVKSFTNDAENRREYISGEDDELIDMLSSPASFDD